MSITKPAPNLIVWGEDNIDPGAIEQARISATMPFIDGHIALMPDAHWGMGSTIGSVIPTKGAIIPAAVGVDIGCGMIAVETTLKARHLPENLTPLLSLIEEAIPAGVGQGHVSSKVAKRMYTLGDPHTSLTEKQGNTSIRQMGTLGSGNHFVEVCLDADETVWIVLHSGSRGIGNQLARIHIDKAKGLMKEYFIDVPDINLAYFIEHTPQFDAYMADLLWAQDYALANRETMMDAVLKALFEVVVGGSLNVDLTLTTSGIEKRRINCHHNYTAREHHHGHNMWITRKGAIRARVGDYGVIPGSMGTNSYIVKGLGNEKSYNSSAHGAGRAMSRKQAEREFTVEDLNEAMGDRTWVESKGRKLVDEIPGAYKRVEDVMAAQADLVEIETELHQILNYKGT